MAFISVQLLLSAVLKQFVYYIGVPLLPDKTLSALRVCCCHVLKLRARFEFVHMLRMQPINIWVRSKMPFTHLLAGKVTAECFAGLLGGLPLFPINSTVQ